MADVSYNLCLYFQVVDIKTGEALGPNEQGEIQIRGPQVMKGNVK